MNIFKIIFALCISMVIGIIAYGQGIPIGKTILVSTSSLKESVDSGEFKSYMSKEFVPAWNKATPGPTMYLLQADRGDRSGEFLTICNAETQKDRKKLPRNSPFTDNAMISVAGDLSKLPSSFLENPDDYTEYHLIGGDQFSSLPSVDLLGIHYLQVKPDMAKDFEKLVVEKLNPTVGHLVHDMNLFYYKAVAGQDKGSFITIFAIESIEARERFWPTGGQEQEIVKKLFEPYKELALELSSYLVENSYLGPESGGGAAYFESMEWTDFVVVDSK